MPAYTAPQLQTLDQSSGSSQPDGDQRRDGARTFKFWVTDRSGKKLDYQRATSLVYTMGLVFGKAEGPLNAPNSSFVVNAPYESR